MVKNITFDISNIQRYIQFRKKCEANCIIVARNYSLPMTWKYNIKGASTTINVNAMTFLRIPLNLIEDAMNGNYDISSEELAERMHRKCSYSSVARYRKLLYKLFTIFPEGIILKKEQSVCCCGENAVLWKPEWADVEPYYSIPEPVEKTQKIRINREKNKGSEKKTSTRDDYC